MEKRGLSSVVTTLLIIMVGVVAVSIIGVVVVSVVRSNSEEVSTTFSTLFTDLKIITAREQGVNIFISVTKKAGDQKISKMVFMLSNDTYNEQITLKIDDKWAELGTKSFTLTPVNLTSAQVESVSIIPIYSVGNNEKIGEIADTFYVDHETSSPPAGGGELPCTPDCVEQICGAPDGCGGLCDQETCEAGQTCEAGVCVPSPAPCVPEDPSTTCGSWVCGSRTNNCNNIVNCGLCPAGEICDTQTGVCNTIVPMNAGTVEDVWPGTSGLYFGSSNLPIYEGAVENFTNRYINFPGSAEMDCLQIVIYRLNVTGYEKAHIGFSSETLIQPEDSYAIYLDSTQCYATLP